MKGKRPAGEGQTQPARTGRSGAMEEGVAKEEAVKAGRQLSGSGQGRGARGHGAGFS